MQIMAVPLQLVLLVLPVALEMHSVDLFMAKLGPFSITLNKLPVSSNNSKALVPISCTTTPSVDL